MIINTDVSSLSLASSAFPTDEEVLLWNQLSSAEKHAVVLRDEEAGFQSGVAKAETLNERLMRVRCHDHKCS